LGLVDTPQAPTLPRGRIAYEHPVEKVSWLAASYAFAPASELPTPSRTGSSGRSRHQAQGQRL